MVLFGNEWQDKSEDVPKTVNTTTSNDAITTTEQTTSSPAASTAISATRQDGDTVNHIYSGTEAGHLINSTTETSPVSSNVNENSVEIADNSIINEYDDDINEIKIPEFGKKFNSNKNLKEGNLEEFIFNHNKSLKIMADCTKDIQIKEDNAEHESQPQNLINNHFAGNNKDDGETNARYNPHTNTNTLTLALQRENNPQQSVLQTAFNASNNVNISVAAAGLQPNFLSQLALAANVAGLQKSTTSVATILTAKQLNQSFNVPDTNNQIKNDSNLLETAVSATSANVSTYDINGQAKIVLICESNSHPFQTRSICLTPNVECMVGRLIAKSKASENNAIFDCKVLSRKHAVIWYTPEGKFWVKDTKSSNGTFINDNKLGEEEAELHFGDIVKFGVDVLENSRKEVHGCIIACVKLYMPDGREAISIESSAHRSLSGEGHISYDELHRLNLYIQETAQREKALNSKLYNIQNVLDSTRKKSALCWQSMITEDQLLHRIQSLEKKLQFMEKNTPENVLRNEVIKLLEDKNSYQHTAKEALRKVYQERCDAMQMLAKMESAYSQSDNECSVLRDQIMNSKQTLQDVNARLLRLEAEYNEYKDEVARQQQEMKNKEEQHITKLTEKLHERELECKDLKKQISDLLIKRADLLQNEEQLLEKQAIEKLDAAIADMDLGDDEDSSEHEDEVDDIKSTQISQENDAKKENSMKIRKPITRPDLASIFGDTLNGIDETSNLKQSKFMDASIINKSPPKRVKESTIMKWLQNSDLNKNEGSLDIFKAICSENENDETNLFSNFSSKLKNVQINLKQLEAEIQNETNNETCAKSDLHLKESGNVKGACAQDEFIIKKNGNTCITNENQMLSKENQKYLLIKSSADMLREAYNEIWNSVKQKDDTQSLEHMEKERTLPREAKSTNSSSTTITMQLDSPLTLRYPESDNTDSDSEVESLSLACTVVESNSKATEHQLMERLKEYKSQVEALNAKLQLSEMDAQHTLEIMQVECDDLRLKMQSLNEIILALESDKNALQQVINDNKNNLPTIETKNSPDSYELEEDSILNAINVTALEREEELITYKERLDEQQKENIVLRNEIALLKQKSNTESAKYLMLRQYLPFCVIILAIIIYFATVYY